MPAISIRGLGKTYETEDGSVVEALRDVSLDIEEKEFVSVVGLSGCGKTTLLYIVAGLIPHSGGRVLLNGREVRGPQDDIGLAFQSSILLPWRTVLDNILLPVEVLGLDRDKYREKAHDLIRLAGLSGFEDRKPRELSGGMQQRVALCRALVHDPSFLLMDEPFGALDALTREKLNLALIGICSQEKKTTLFITHSINEAVFLSDRVVLMTPRPGTIHKVFPIDLPKPRENATQSAPMFSVHVNEIRREIMAM